MEKVKAYRTIFLSDLHMGWSKSNCGDAALFLDQSKCDILYLNGDIFDGWKLKRRWFWAEDHDFFISALLRKVDEGTHIILHPGNHDETLRNPALRGMIAKLSQKYGFTFASDSLHQTATGDTLKIMHGDQFDDDFTRRISETADKLYNGSIEAVKGLGRPKKVNKKAAFSLAQYFRKLAKGGGASLDKSNETFIKHITKNLSADTSNNDINGVVLGHTHMPCIETHPMKGFAKNAFFYANSGDWVQNMTALVETKNGDFKLIEAETELALRYFEDHKALKKNNRIKMHPKTASLRHWLHKLWSPTSLQDSPSYSGTSKKQRKERIKKIFF